MLLHGGSLLAMLSTSSCCPRVTPSDGILLNWYKMPMKRHLNLVLSPQQCRSVLASPDAARSALCPMPYRDALQKVLGSFDEGSLVGAIGAAVKLKVSMQDIHNGRLSELCICSSA